MAKLINLRAPKTQMLVFLFSFIVYFAYTRRDLYLVLLAILISVYAMCLDGLLHYSQKKKLLLSESACISGMIIALVLSAHNPWWLFFFAGSVAILSKYFLRLKNKHIFNPAALGIMASIILFGAVTEWKGTYSWYILVPFGLYFAYRVRKIGLLLGYALTTYILFGAACIAEHTSSFLVFGWVSYFYIFVMLIEPKTTPVRPWGKFLFGAAAALLIFVFTGMGVRFDVELATLLALNLTVPLLNALPERRRR